MSLIFHQGREKGSYRTPNTEHWTPNTGHRPPGTGHIESSNCFPLMDNRQQIRLSSDHTKNSTHQNCFAYWICSIFTALKLPIFCYISDRLLRIPINFEKCIIIFYMHFGNSRGINFNIDFKCRSSVFVWLYITLQIINRGKKRTFWVWAELLDIT